jgi:murein DD-endopeptidase MepM/ murein hydrolase activator NlpD
VTNEVAGAEAAEEELKNIEDEIEDGNDISTIIKQIIIKPKSDETEYSFVNPTGKGIRGCDAQGCGGYGATRENKDGTKRYHWKIDIISEPGQDVVAPAEGVVDRIVSGKYDGMVVGDGKGMSWKILYVDVAKGLKRGSIISKGQVWGKAQDITDRYPGIINHVDVKLRINYKVVNPADYIPIPVQ